MAITVHLRTDMYNTVALVVEGVLEETLYKQADRITELEARVRNHEKLELRALRLSMKPRKKL